MCKKEKNAVFCHRRRTVVTTQQNHAQKWSFLPQKLDFCFASLCFAAFFIIAAHGMPIAIFYDEERIMP